MNLDKQAFLNYRKEFSLGFLTTESFHPKSKNLSEDCKNNLEKAIITLKEIDVSALEKLKSYSQNIFELQQQCQKAISTKRKIFLSGCGATGRLALSLEKLFRDKFQSDQVVGFMAGGDYALIKSVESFEDNTSFGARQLLDLGFEKEDLVIGITEGGETSFVIGSVEYAASESTKSPYFIYCNPDHELHKIKRSANVLYNEKIKKCNLTIGPMAISGSTRMQATTVQMLAVGFALLYKHESLELFEKDFFQFIDDLTVLDYASLDSFIQNEYEAYKSGGVVHYQSDDHIALAILTDTTERAPTFNLQSFETKNETELALSYLSVGNGHDDKKAWYDLLGREPRGLTWPELEFSLDNDRIYEFDISQNSLARRKKQHHNFHSFDILDEDGGFLFNLEGHLQHFRLRQQNLFFKHMALKLLLNSHSTLVMGKLGRYEGNMMTYVRASNMKLIDRATRYIQHYLDNHGYVYNEEYIVNYIFENLDYSGGPLVKKVIDIIKKTNA